MKLDDEYFRRLYAGNDDPWRQRTRWSEHRRRALILASLPRQRYRNALELGCGNGELTAALAPRAEKLIAGDLNRTAVRLATERLMRFPHARAELMFAPQDWPSATFDLIVISEMAYYLDPSKLHRLIERTRSSLDADGTLVLCHGRHMIPGFTLNGNDVHREFTAALLNGPLERVVRHTESEFLLEVWSARGVAADELVKTLPAED